MDKVYPVLGHSMRFALEPGDAVEARPCAPADLRAGDIALLVRWAGGLPSGYVLHRVLLNLGLGGRRLLLTKGDARLLPDWPPGDFQPSGLAVSVSRGGRRYALPRGPWPALPLSLYSLCAAKSLNFLLYCSSAAAAACRRLPGAFREGPDRAFLLWEQRLYPALQRALAAPSRPAGGEAAGPPAQMRSGRICSDETWSGAVKVADYLIIEPGVKVTVAPGARISFERSEPWFFPVSRAGSPELDSAGAKVLVYGELRAEGTSAAPIVFSGRPFSGLHALGSGRVVLGNCAVSAAAGCALSARDGAALSAASCRLSGERGAETYDRARAVFEDCSVLASSGPAFLASGFSSLAVRGGAASGEGGPAAEVSGRAAADFSGFTAEGLSSGFLASQRSSLSARDCRALRCLGAAAEISGMAGARFSGFDAGDCGSGISLADSAALELEGSRIGRAGGAALACGGSSRLRASGCEFAENPAGACVSGGAVAEFRDCAFSGCAGPSAAVLGASGASFTACRFGGGRGPYIESRGPSLVTLAACSFAGGESALSSEGPARLRLAGCEVSGAAGAAVAASGAADLAAEDCTFLSCGSGFLAESCTSVSASRCRCAGSAGAAAHVEGFGEAAFAGCSFSGNSGGVHFAGRTRAALLGCALDSDARSPLSVAGAAQCAAEKCSFSGNATGIRVSGEGGLEASGCDFTGNRGPALEAEGDAYISASACRAEGEDPMLVAGDRSRSSLSCCRASARVRPAVSVSGLASVVDSGSSFSSAASAVYSSGGARLEFTGSSFEGGAGAALDLRGGELLLRGITARGRGALKLSRLRLRAEGLRLSGAEYSLEASGCDVLVRGLEALGGGRGGVLLSDGSASLTDASVSGAPHPGFAFRNVSPLSLSGLSAGGRPWAPPAPPPRRPRLRAAAARFAAATAGVRPFSALYRLLYQGASALAGPALRPAGGSVYLYRGMASGSWKPGLSDMDLAVALPQAAPAREWEAFKALRGRLRAFRLLFPFTGEALCATGPELAAFLGGWGLKGTEFRRASALLAGDALPLPPEGGCRLADKTEAYYAYTLLLSHFLDESLPPAFRRRNCAKGLADVRRCLDAASPQRASRAGYAAAAGFALDGPGAPAPGESAWLAFRALHEAAAAGAAGPAAPPPPAGWFNAHAFSAACGRLRAAAGCGLGVALDSLYRVYAVLPDEEAASEQAFLRAAGALRRAREAGDLSAAPLLLSARAFGALAALPYLNNPLFAAGLYAGEGGGSPSDGGVFSWNLALPAQPGAADLLASARLAARHHCASWRCLWEAMPPHYHYTRAAGLRLLLSGTACPPFSSPRALGAAFGAAFGGPGWDEFQALDEGGRYRFAAEQSRALLEAALGN